MLPLLRFWQVNPLLGDAHSGCDSSAVRDQLKGVQQIHATDAAFAAILEDGSVVTWGDRRYGGDTSAVQDQLRGAQQRTPLLRFWKMDPLLPGVMQNMAVTVLQFEISLGVCSKFNPDVLPLLRFWQVDPLLGDAHSGGDSSAVRDQLKGVQQNSSHRGRLLLRFWKMDPSLPGVMQDMAVTVLQFEISLGVCSKFKPQSTPLLRFWKMDLWLPGVIHTMVVTLRQFEISSRVFSPVVCLPGVWLKNVRWECVEKRM